MMTMRIEPALLDILACPIDKQGLLYLPDEALLYNPRLRRAYQVADGYLMMLADQAEPVTPDEHDRLMKRADHGEAIGTAGLAPDSAGDLAAVPPAPRLRPGKEANHARLAVTVFTRRYVHVSQHC